MMKVSSCFKYSGLYQDSTKKPERLGIHNCTPIPIQSSVGLISPNSTLWYKNSYGIPIKIDFTTTNVIAPVEKQIKISGISIPTNSVKKPTTENWIHSQPTCNVDFWGTETEYITDIYITI
jgi:hypothetical protein